MKSCSRVLLPIPAAPDNGSYRISGGMIARFFSLGMVVLLLPYALWGQNAVVEGTVVKKNRNAALVGAHIRLVEQDDSTRSFVASTDENGHFEFSNIRRATYTMEVTYLGYGKLSRTVTIDKSRVDVETLTMSEKAIPLKEVVVEGRTPAAEQKGDTIEYNAQAFKINRDATAEELIKKMPGVTVQNSVIKAQGEEVQQVLVDGQQFFGNDPMVALRNLPADVIDKVQVFDKLSDQAQLTGFNDGQSSKTINIVTRPDRRRGEFGRLNGGYGTDDRYTVGGSIHHFASSRRLSAIGLSNNVNQQNFSMQDILGVMSGGSPGEGPGTGGMFGPGGEMGGAGAGGGPPPGGGGGAGNFFIGQQGGSSTVHSGGVNYSDSLGKNLHATGSYFYNRTDNANPQVVSRQYVIPQDSIVSYNESSETEQKNENHRLNVRFEYAPDSSNSFIASPELSFQDNQRTSSVNAINRLTLGAVSSQSESNNRTNSSGYTSRGDLVYRHKFAIPGRTFSADVSVGKDRQESSGEQTSLNEYGNAQDRSDTLAQRSNSLLNGSSLSTNFAYTEPISAWSLLQATYSRTYTNNSSDRRTYGDLELDSTLSNSYENEYETHKAGVMYNLRGGSFSGMAGVSYQIADLRGRQSFPQSIAIEKTFYTILPNAMVNYQLSRRRNVQLLYRTSTTSPSIGQLQNVVDNSNTLLLSAGNPNLKQSYSQTFLTRLSLVNSLTSQSFMLFVSLSHTKDYIGNSTLVAQSDSLMPDGIRLNRGTQLTRPVNLDGYWSANSFCTYGAPLDLIECSLNLNAGVTYTRTPALVDGQRSLSNAYSLNPGFVLGSNFSEDFDFTVSYTASFTFTSNAIQSASGNNYTTHTAALQLNCIFWEGIVARTDMKGTLNSGLTSGQSQNTLTWNVSIGKKFLPDERGELLLTAYDLLNENKSINRRVAETYIEETISRVLPRYFMLTFTYNLRHFSPS